MCHDIEKRVNGHNIVGDSHAPIYNMTPDMRPTKCVEINCVICAKIKAVTQQSEENIVNGHNIVGDSHAPIYNITPHLRATQCVQINCVKSAKSEVVPQETHANEPNVVFDSHVINPNFTHTLPHLRATHCVTYDVCDGTDISEPGPQENSANVFSVVRDFHVTNPNITHTLPHLRATHCVTYDVCDGTDISEPGPQGHENASSSDSSYSNQNCSKVVGDSHLQDQQEESEESLTHGNSSDSTLTDSQGCEDSNSSDSSCSNQSWPNVVGDSHLPDHQQESDEDDNDSDSQENRDSDSTVGNSETPTPTKNNLTLIHWNTQGSNEKIGFLQAEIAKHDIDVVLLQDTRLKKRQDGIPKLRVDGYHTYHIPLSEDPAVQCHGLTTLVSNRVPSKLITQPPDIGESTEVLSVKIWHENKPIDIHNIYRVEPANIDLSPIFTNGHTSIIAGDFNARHTSWCRKDNTTGKDLKNQLDATTQFVLLNEPQVWTTINDSVLDLAICSNSLAAFADWSSFPELVSDHIAVKITIHKQYTYNGYNHNQGYLGQHADWEKYSNEVTRQLQVTDTSGIWTLV